jgi:hypothetical protein
VEESQDFNALKVKSVTMIRGIVVIRKKMEQIVLGYVKRLASINGW